MHKNKRIWQYCAIASCSFSCIAVGIKMFADVRTTGAETVRMGRLKEIGNRKAAGACLELKSKALITEGQLIQLPAGKSPTSCFKNKATKQYVYAGYLNGQLQAIALYTDTEVKKGTTND